MSLMDRLSNSCCCSGKRRGISPVLGAKKLRLRAKTSFLLESVHKHEVNKKADHRLAMVFFVITCLRLLFLSDDTATF